MLRRLPGAGAYLARVPERLFAQNITQRFKRIFIWSAAARVTHLPRDGGLRLRGASRVCHRCESKRVQRRPSAGTTTQPCRLISGATVCVYPGALARSDCCGSRRKPRRGAHWAPARRRVFRCAGGQWPPLRARASSRAFIGGRETRPLRGVKTDLPLRIAQELRSRFQINGRYEDGFVFGRLRAVDK